MLSWSPLYSITLRHHKARSGLDEAHLFKILSPILLMFFFKPNCFFSKPNYFFFKPIYIMDHYMGTGTNIVAPGTRDTLVRGTFRHCCYHKSLFSQVRFISFELGAIFKTETRFWNRTNLCRLTVCLCNFLLNYCPGKYGFYF